MSTRHKPGSFVIFTPTDWTLGHIQLHPKYGPKIGHIYQVESVNEEGLPLLKNGFGPYLPDDLKIIECPDMERVENPLPMPSLHDMLKENGVDVPNFKTGDAVVFQAKWATVQAAPVVGWPIFGNIYIIRSVEKDGLSIRLEGLEREFPSWHFKKHEK